MRQRPAMLHHRMRRLSPSDPSAAESLLSLGQMEDASQRRLDEYTYLTCSHPDRAREKVRYRKIHALVPEDTCTRTVPEVP